MTKIILLILALKNLHWTWICEKLEVLKRPLWVPGKRDLFIFVLWMCSCRRRVKRYFCFVLLRKQHITCESLGKTDQSGFVSWFYPSDMFPTDTGLLRQGLHNNDSVPLFLQKKSKEYKKEDCSRKNTGFHSKTGFPGCGMCLWAWSSSITAESRDSCSKQNWRQVPSNDANNCHKSSNSCVCLTCWSECCWKERQQTKQNRNGQACWHWNAPSYLLSFSVTVTDVGKREVFSKKGIFCCGVLPCFSSRAGIRSSFFFQKNDRSLK